MSRNVAMLVSTVGLVGLLVSALADSIGIGSGGGIGTKQTTGIAISAVVLLVGLVSMSRAKTA